MRGKMKGQAFIILAIILVLILFLVKNLSPRGLIIKEESIEELEFENLKHEILKTVQISCPEIENITKNLNKFVKFARNSLKQRGVDLNCFLVGIFYPNVTPNQETKLNVSILNLLGSEIQVLNLTFSYDNTSKVFNSVADGRKIETSFWFNTSVDTNYTLRIFYRTSVQDRTEKILIPVKIGKSKFIGFFDLELIGKNKQKEKFSEIC